jgi:hypothetical protein
MSNYKIVGIYNGKRETIDTAGDLVEAKYLVGEYQLAFGNDWLVYYSPRKIDRHPDFVLIKSGSTFGTELETGGVK